MINKHSLIIRLAFILVLTSAIAGAVIMQLYYNERYNEEMDKAMTAIDQIERTVSSTASIAVYLQDEDLAKEVINGLLKNHSILSAQITAQKVTLAKSTHFKQDNARIYPLYNPFFITEAAGKVYIVPNQMLIERLARDTAQENAHLLMAQTFFVLFIFIVLAYFIITKPMALLSHQLEQIIPGKANRLVKPATHSQSEIGKITDKINSLLDKTQTLFEREITLRKEVETLEKRLRLLFDTSSSATILAHENGEVLLYNNSTKTLFERLGITLTGNFREVLPRAVKVPEALLSHVRHAFETNDVANGEFEFINYNSDEQCWINVLVTRNQNDSRNTYLQIFLTDISAHRAKLEKLNQVAHFDKLTDIFNRHGAELAITNLLKVDANFALMLLDLDGFKPINDTYGHNTGDELLQHVARKLESSLRKEDVCARWGGDEFLVCVTNVKASEALLLAEKLKAAISEPVAVTYQGKQLQVKVGASIGIALAPEHGKDLLSLIKAADTAMYQVKNHQKNGAYIYLS